MAKPQWLTANPMSGSGNDDIQFSATPFTGRVQRQGTATVTGSGAPTPVTVTVTQSPKAEFVSFDQSEWAAAKAGQTVTITGKSNSTKLNFTWVADGDNNPIPDIEIPAEYKVNGTNTDNNVDITGDPGATAEFTFSIDIVVPENETTQARQKTLSVAPASGSAVQTVIKQAAGDAFIWVNEEGTSTASITIPQEGTAQSVTVLSNTSWTVS